MRLQEEIEFKRAVEFSLAQEVGADPNGGYTNDPDDPGGETKWGISKRSYPDLDIKNLTRDQAIAIYRRDFWDAANCVRWEWPLSLAYFDTAVNAGASRAGKLLQQAAGVGVDGVIGARTMSAVAKRTLTVGDTVAFTVRFIKARKDFYLGLNKPKYLAGWLNRLFDLTVAVVKEI